MMVIMLLPLILLMLISLIRAEPHKKLEGSFFIYDWPDYINDVWPPMNSTLNPNSSFSHNFRGNNGAGQAVDPSIGYFSTWQFSMYQLTMARLRASPYRTLNPAEAMTFIVPFDIGVHSYIDHLNGRTRVASPHGWRVIEWMKESIVKHGENIVWKNRGHDHFVLFSITSYQIIGIGAKVFLTQICQNCSVLTIETTPTLTCRKYYSNKSRKWWYAVPYPSSYHWHEGIQELPWKAPSYQYSNQYPYSDSHTISKAVVAAEEEIHRHRPYLTIFIGSVDTSTPRSNVVRRIAKRDCLQDQSSSSDKKRGQCLWFDTAHSCSGVLNQTDGMLLYRKTIFCLAPTGDSLTRKSLFDSMVAGCIPVVFAKATITQYLWHVPPEIVDKVSVYIPAQSVIDNSINFIDFLRNNISSEQIVSMQQELEKLAPSLQYSILPYGYGATEEEAWRYFQLSQFGYQWNTASQQHHKLNKRTTKDATPAPYPGLENETPLSTIPPSKLNLSGYRYRGKTWSPPFRDAVDVMVERLLNRSTVEPLEGFTEEQAINFAKLRDDISAEDPDYVGLARIGQVLASKEKRRRDRAAGLDGYTVVPQKPRNRKGRGKSQSID